MFRVNLEHVCSYHVHLQNPPEVIGPTPEGIRVNFYPISGEVSGPKIRGRVLPRGGDWIVIRPDGVGILDVRGTIETHDGVLIYVDYTGVGDLGEDGYQRFLWGDLTGKLQLRGAARLHTAHADYRWVNRLQFLNIGEADLQDFEATYDLYAVH
jgi:hypothetical protein